ncbi:perforin-1-like [Heteronotia binoei]|uniref:perforin-1-like n=1 Tax=Heteronotia binoei TaxID=13085 RepID=UPI00292FA848|nr:perforin-1-like [Heteronotia binoei]
MPKLHFFLAASFGFLCLLQPAASGYCQEFPNDVCQASTSFVPGHNLLGEGFDVTTLSRKGASVVDTSRWQGPNGTCTLCRNPKMGSEKQRLPLMALDWRAYSTCEQRVDASMQHSELEVANAMATEVTNDWKVELGLPPIQAAFGASRSQATVWAHQYSQRDSYTFIMHETSCENYQLRLASIPSLLTPHFSHDVSNLPMEYPRKEYQRFINIYGTHYISQMKLGARSRHLFGVRNCKAALNGFTVSDFKDCLNVDTSLGSFWKNHFHSSKCIKLRREEVKGNLRDTFVKWHVAVMGGEEPEKMLSSEAPHLSEWLQSAKRHPEVVSYSLTPLYTLLSQSNPRRKALKQAISDYITERALRRSCDKQCPYDTFRSPEDHCSCMCHDSGLTDNNCCARARGRAHLKFYVKTASDLWGDHFSAADAYVKVLFQGRERRTRVIAGTNSPEWHETLDFGTVTLSYHNTFYLEVWDSDTWDDDVLHIFEGELKAGGTHEFIGHLTYGHITFSYELKCAPTLSGPSCQTYIPLKQRAPRP